MKKYLMQLTEDLRAAHRSENDIPSPRKMTFKEEFEEIEDWLEDRQTATTQTFGEVCGIKKEQLPPVEKLTKKQQETICNEIKNLLFSWNISLDLPEKLPRELAYKFFTDCFDEKIMIAEWGQVNFSFCEEKPEKCIFGEYCSCIENRKKFEKELQINDAKANSFIEKLSALFLTNKKIWKVQISTETPDFEKLKHTQTLAEWLGFKNEEIPVFFQVDEIQTGAILFFLMKLWDKNDPMNGWMEDMDAEEKYELWENYLKSEVWFDGKKRLYFKEAKNWEMVEKKESYDLEELFSDEEEGDWDEDDDLPF